jgi:hypothetical protein
VVPQQAGVTQLAVRWRGRWRGLVRVGGEGLTCTGSGLHDGKSGDAQGGEETRLGCHSIRGCLGASEQRDMGAGRKGHQLTAAH